MNVAEGFDVVGMMVSVFGSRDVDVIRSVLRGDASGYWLRRDNLNFGGWHGLRTRSHA